MQQEKNIKSRYNEYKKNCVPFGILVLISFFIILAIYIPLYNKIFIKYNSLLRILSGLLIISLSILLLYIGCRYLNKSKMKYNLFCKKCNYIFTNKEIVEIVAKNSTCPNCKERIY